MSLNQTKATSILNCRVEVALKDKFTMLAGERGMNVNQWLTILVEEAVANKNEERLETITQERNALEEQVKLWEQQKENAQIRYNEIIKSLEEDENKHFFFIPKWGWKKIKELSPAILQASATRSQ